MYFLQGSQRVIRLGLLGAMLVLSGAPAYAQKPPAAALVVASEVVTATGATALFNTLIPGVIEQAKLLFLQQNPGMAKDVNEIAAKMRSDLAPRLGELNGQVAKIYAERFNEQELKDLLAFYKSPVGKKFIEQQPLVAEASLKFAQDWANKLSDEVIAKMRNELKKKGHAL
jgi:hypothetical protein